MSAFMGRLTVALAFCASIVCAAPNQKTSHLNWFSPKKNVCPEGTHVPSVQEWDEIGKELFTGPRKVHNMKSFVGKDRGYKENQGKKSKVKSKEASYFPIAGSDDGKSIQAMMFDVKRGNYRPVKLPATAILPMRCVSERDPYAEKGISKNDMIFTDSRDGNKYKVEERAGKFWMKSNLKFGLKNASQCFLEDTVFCQKHGRFYTQTEAKKACPKGWKLPDDGDWRDYQKDQSTLDWGNLGVGGCRDWDEYCDQATTGHYWSATSTRKGTGRAWEFRKVGRSINRTDESVQKGLYVRCVADL